MPVTPTSGRRAAGERGDQSEASGMGSARSCVRASAMGRG
uniref:Uncharacterized protein n=1 Tax=Arundo donax TaxID=35708 RepID=A0A0A8XTR8_ARUDO